MWLKKQAGRAEVGPDGEMCEGGRRRVPLEEELRGVGRKQIRGKRNGRRKGQRCQRCCAFAEEHWDYFRYCWRSRNDATGSGYVDGGDDRKGVYESTVRLRSLDERTRWAT